MKKKPDHYKISEKKLISLICNLTLNLTNIQLQRNIFILLIIPFQIIILAKV